MSNQTCVETASPGEAPSLICAGVHGGIRDVSRDIIAGPVTASVYSSSCDGGKGGDIHYFGVCRGERLTRVAIADVMGHGRAVTDVSRFVYQAVQTHMCNEDSGAILSELNRLVIRRGLKAMTTAAVLSCDAERGEFRVSSAGHPPFLSKRHDRTSWSVVAAKTERDDRGPHVADLPLGILPDAVFNQQVIRMAQGDRLFIYTDGLSEAPDPEGNQFGTERLREVLDANAEAATPDLLSAVCRALERHRGGAPARDDVTFIALQVR